MKEEVEDFSIYDAHGEKINCEHNCKHKFFLSDIHDTEWDLGYLTCKKCNCTFLLPLKEYEKEAQAINNKDIEIIEKVMKGG